MIKNFSPSHIANGLNGPYPFSQPGNFWSGSGNQSTVSNGFTPRENGQTNPYPIGQPYISPNRHNVTGVTVWV